jgi:hypothetical protein
VAREARLKRVSDNGIGEKRLGSLGKIGVLGKVVNYDVLVYWWECDGLVNIAGSPRGLPCPG